MSTPLSITTRLTVRDRVSRWPRLAVGSAIVILFILLGLLASLALGAVDIPLKEIFKIVSGEGSEASRQIVFEARLPRAIAAVLVGANLAVSGALLQAVTRNPLADPGLIGVTAGAGLAATIVLAVLPGSAMLLPIVAFVGAMVAAVVVYTVSWRPGAGSSPMRMILAGVAVNAVLGAVIGLLMTAYADRIPALMFWTSGSFNGRGWGHVEMLWPYTLIGLGLALWLRPRLAVMELGDDSAVTMGVPVERTRLIAFAAAALLAGSAASVAGLVGFVGLVVPHLVRLLLGGNFGVIPVAAVAGGALLLWSDLVARLALAPAEIPVGVVTGLIGGPYFIYLLYRARWLR
ncbi:MAG: iron ABC transporter permease [Phycisphaerales bacterium]|nr:iron ABC transporter permease [Phycisphaerales bacterium]